MNCCTKYACMLGWKQLSYQRIQIYTETSILGINQIIFGNQIYLLADVVLHYVLDAYFL